MKTVLYTSSQLLSCARCNGEAIICLDHTLVATDQPYITVTVASTTNTTDNCGRTRYVYGLTYDEAQLADPAYDLVSTDVLGIFCKGCLTDYIDAVGAPSLQYILDLLGPYFDGVCLVTTEAEFISAIGNVNCCSILVTAPFTLTANRSVPVGKQLEIRNCCEITTTGHVLTINGTFVAGDYLCFVTTAGEVKFGSGSTVSVRGEWFGAVGDGVTDDTAAWQAAIIAAYFATHQSLWVQPLSNKTYLITQLTLYRNFYFGCMSTRNGGARFLGSAATAMFVLDDADRPVHGEFFGLIVDGGSVATTLIDAQGSDLCEIHDCQLLNGVVGIDLTGGCLGIRILRNQIGGLTMTYGVRLSGDCLSCVIEQNFFYSSHGPSLYSIYSDTDSRADRCSVKNNVFDVPLAHGYIKWQVDTGSPILGLSVVISENHMENSVTVADIWIGEDAVANIHDNSVAESDGYAILIDGAYCSIHDNYLIPDAGAGIALGATSYRCMVGFNHMNATPQITDAGTENHVWRVPARMGPTADRGSFAQGTLTALDAGAVYLDTDLDADGKPIFWNGVAWVDATGAVV